MGREQRRRAEREQRRRAQKPTNPPVRSAPSRSDALLDALRAGQVAPDVPARVAAPAPVPAAGEPSLAARREPPAAQAPPPTTSAVTTVSSLQTTDAGCGPVDGVDPQALGITYTVDATEDGEPYPLTVRFVGRRTGLSGEPGPRDAFDVVESVARVVPGSGRVTLTRRIENISAGEWQVAALPVADPADRRPLPAPAKAAGGTGYAPIVRVRAPGVRIGAWPGLVGLGAVAALTVQWFLAARFGLPSGQVLLLSLVACLLGLVGARLYYMVEHPQRWQGLVNTPTGMCIQGFVLAAIGTVVVGALVLGLPVGRLVDVSAPGLMLGMTIGRVGCFLGGCCAGRPTGSRFGLWSSDRRLGVRRVPTQLFESTMALAVGLTAAAALTVAAPEPGGVVFVAVIAAYTLGRQLLFPLRSLPRNTNHGRTLTMVACVAVLAGAVLVAAVS